MSEKTSSWPAYWAERPVQLVLPRRVGGGVANDRQQPGEERGRGKHERGERHGDPPELLPRHERADDEEAREGQPEKDRVGRMDDRQDEARGGDRREHLPVRPLDVGERECERGGNEQLARGRRGQRQRRVGAAVSRREAP